MKQRSRVIVVLTLAAAAAGSISARAAGGPPPVRTVRLPHGGVHAQATVDPAGVIHLAYVRGDPMRGDAFYVRSADGGETFSAPLRINSHEGSVIVTGTVRGPQIALGRSGRIHAAWMGSDKALPKAPGRQTPMLYSRLNDAGDAFEPQRNLIRQRPGLDGGGSVAADGEGNVYVAWHAPQKDNTEADRRVWLVRSRDDGQTFGPEEATDPRPLGVCACCGMKVTTGSRRGELYVLYRSAADKVHRDMQVLASTDYGRTFAVSLAHPWHVGQCVMSTSALAPGGDAGLAAWETRKQIYVARLRGNVPLTEPAAAPGDGDNRKHPAVAAAADGRHVVAWTEGTGWNKGGRVAWQVFDAGGRPVAGAAGSADGLPAWGVPAAVALPDGTFRIIY